MIGRLSSIRIVTSSPVLKRNWLSLVTPLGMKNEYLLENHRDPDTTGLLGEMLRKYVNVKS